MDLVNNNTEIKYVPLVNKVVIDEKNNIAKYNNNIESMQISETKMYSDENSNNIQLPDIKFHQGTSSQVDQLIRNNNNKAETKTFIPRSFKIEKLYLIITAVLSSIILSLIILLMYKSTLLSRLDLTLNQQKLEYEALKQKIMFASNLSFCFTITPKPVIP